MIGRGGDVLLIGTADSIGLSPLTMVSYLGAEMIAGLIAYSAYFAFMAFRRRGLSSRHLLAIAAPTAADVVILFGFWTPQRPRHSSLSDAGLRAAVESFINNVAHVTLQAMMGVGSFALIGVVVALVQQQLESQWSPRWPTARPMR